MLKTNPVLRLLSRVLILLPLLFSGTTLLAQSHIGKWVLWTQGPNGSPVLSYSDSNRVEIEFAADSTVKLRMPKVERLVQGTWKLKEDSILVKFDSFPNRILTGAKGQAGKEIIERYAMSFLGKDTLALQTDLNLTKLIPASAKIVAAAPALTPKYNAPLSRGNKILNGMIGVFGLLLIGLLLSNNRRRINWPLIAKAIIIQVIFAYCILNIPQVGLIFSKIAGGFVQILEFTKAGSRFLFGSLVEKESIGFVFVFQVLPTIVFFAALTSLLFYLNILQRIVFVFAWIMKKIMGLSGAESLASAANIFVGQTEAPLVIKPYIASMTRSETMALMTGGMAHISGGILATYIGLLGGDDPVQQQIFATHLLSASIMTAPGTFFAAKMLIPETESFNKEMRIPKERIGSNFLDAIANGTGEGLKLAANVAAMLLVFISLMAMFNYIMRDGIGAALNVNDAIVQSTDGRSTGLTLEYLLGWAFAPMSWLIGIRGDDVFLVGQLLGQKTILNEFIAFQAFNGLKGSMAFANSNTIIITTYALCGFANFASIGIQIGGIGTLAPSKRAMLASLGMKALIGGTMANLMSAAIAGMMV